MQSFGDNNPDLIYIDQSPNNSQEVFSTYPQDETTHPSKIIHVEQQYLKPKKSYHRPPVPTKIIKRIADAIFDSKGRGLTYEDLLKPPYKCANTEQQARNILYYHQKKGTLYSNPSSMTIPQQYFLSKQDAEEVAINHKKSILCKPKAPVIYPLRKSSTPPQPTGVASIKIVSNYAEITAIEDKKVDNLAEAIDRVSQDAGGELPTGIHNIRIHLSLPQEYVTEVYYERLAHLSEPPTKREKAKTVSTMIDGFEVRMKFYPKSNTVVIMVPCSDVPFPISLNSPERVTSDFNSFVAQIRRVICAHLSDNKGRIVPPIHSPVWRLIHADINWDIPTTTLSYLSMDGIQVTKVNDIVVRVYRKRIMGERFVRVEEGVHSFMKDTQEGFNDSIGSVIVGAARRAQKKLPVSAE